MIKNFKKFTKVMVLNIFNLVLKVLQKNRK